MTPLVLHTDDKPDVIRTVSIDYDPDAREVTLHDCIQEPDRGQRTVTTYTAEDAEIVGRALVELAARVRVVEPRQLSFVC